MKINKFFVPPTEASGEERSADVSKEDDEEAKMPEVEHGAAGDSAEVKVEPETEASVHANEEESAKQEKEENNSENQAEEKSTDDRKEEESKMEEVDLDDTGMSLLTYR